MSPRVIWKGAISFGLVHVPVALYPASQDSGIDFDWLDRRSMDPVGYQRINKRTGKPIKGDDVVKGVQQEGGEYVIVSDEQIKAAYPVFTQTIEIETFEGVRPVARGHGPGGRDRHCARGHAHQGTPGRADPHGACAGAQHHPLGQRDPPGGRPPV